LIYFSKKYRAKLTGRIDDADSDSDFNANDDSNRTLLLISQEQKLKDQYNNIELLEKRF